MINGTGMNAQYADISNQFSTLNDRNAGEYPKIVLKRTMLLLPRDASVRSGEGGAQDSSELEFYVGCSGWGGVGGVALTAAQISREKEGCRCSLRSPPSGNSSSGRSARICRSGEGETSEKVLERRAGKQERWRRGWEAA